MEVLPTRVVGTTSTMTVFLRLRRAMVATHQQRKVQTKFPLTSRPIMMPAVCPAVKLMNPNGRGGLEVVEEDAGHMDQGEVGHQDQVGEGDQQDEGKGEDEEGKIARRLGIVLFSGDVLQYPRLFEQGSKLVGGGVVAAIAMLTKRLVAKGRLLTPGWMTMLVFVA